VNDDDDGSEHDERSLSMTGSKGHEDRAKPGRDRHANSARPTMLDDDFLSAIQDLSRRYGPARPASLELAFFTRTRTNHANEARMALDHSGSIRASFGRFALVRVTFFGSSRTSGNTERAQNARHHKSFPPGRFSAADLDAAVPARDRSAAFSGLRAFRVPQCPTLCVVEAVLQVIPAFDQRRSQARPPRRWPPWDAGARFSSTKRARCRLRP
jgi:hypothetical protein